MNLGQLKHFYAEHEFTSAISDHLVEQDSSVCIKKNSGSLLAFYAFGTIIKKKGIHVFILEDRESAVYFFNDLENLNDQDFKIIFYPKSYRQPYEEENIDNANISMRAEVLHAINKNWNPLVIVTFPEAIAENVLNQKTFTLNSFDIALKEQHDLDELNKVLIDFSFDKVDFVHEPGQFSIRGGIVDIFSFSDEHPIRIELLGDEIDSIRRFDPITQRSVANLQKLTIVPNIEHKLSHENHEPFLKFLPDSTNFWISSPEVVQEKIEQEKNLAVKAFKNLNPPVQRIAPDQLYSNSAEFLEIISKRSKILFGNTEFQAQHIVSLEGSPQPAFRKNFDMLIKDLEKKSKDDYSIILAATHSKQVERLYSIFEDLQAKVIFQPIVLTLQAGFVDHHNKIACYTDHQIFERYNRFRLKEGFKKTKEALSLKDLIGLKPGDYITHIDHGIGQFSGLEKIDVNGKKQEAIRLIYKGNDILYVSIHALHRISKYTGKDGTPPSVHRLGSGAWAKTKAKTKSKVKKIAFDLIKLYAKRKASRGFAFSPDSYLQTELEASFLFEDTPDQLQATLDVKKDMESPSPMDRLVCGDVGFGKTEIAIRAAFKAVADNKQVAILVPTTILSFQHFHSFQDRLRDFPATIDFTNRFKSQKENNETMKRLADGQTDIIIGTHKLLNKNIKFKDLGLLVIDEEQKFGVGAKDRLKTLKENVDTLTLTATPIPRTLHFSMMGARDLSIINTPPPNRQPVHTEIRTFNEALVRDSITNELSRAGQVFFVHNRIENIKEVAGMIQRLCPDARVRIGHGQMDGKELEKVMIDFIEFEYDVLVCTTIIESGIDIPNANTIIINNANNFGLSDLHQLRGRVGRSNKKAHCYFISPPLQHVSSDARKRLQALEQFTNLGSGIHIAMRDLDIRGAGNLLGGEQSGFITDIGFEMYQKILKEAIDELKETEFKELYKEEIEAKGEYVRDFSIESDFEMLIEDDYVISIAERLELYRKLNEVNNESELNQFREELVDRFGPIPDATETLLNSLRLKWIAPKLGFEKLVLKSGKMIGYFVSQKESPYYHSHVFNQILKYVQANPQGVKMYEKKESLRLAIQGVHNIKDASKILDNLLSKKESEITL